MKVVCERCGKSGQLGLFAKYKMEFGKDKFEFALCEQCHNALMNAFLAAGYAVQTSMDGGEVQIFPGTGDTGAD